MSVRAIQVDLELRAVAAAADSGVAEITDWLRPAVDPPRLRLPPRGRPFLLRLPVGTAACFGMIVFGFVQYCGRRAQGGVAVAWR
jgi:hypothetical protein